MHVEVAQSASLVLVTQRISRGAELPNAIGKSIHVYDKRNSSLWSVIPSFGSIEWEVDRTLETETSQMRGWLLSCLACFRSPVCQLRLCASRYGYIVITRTLHRLSTLNHPSLLHFSCIMSSFWLIPAWSTVLTSARQGYPLRAWSASGKPHDAAIVS